MSRATSRQTSTLADHAAEHQTGPPEPVPAGPSARRRVLILSADVGEGHAAAARAVASELEAADPGIDVQIVDGLAWMGRVVLHIVRDGYRFQLRYIPWSYGLLYTLATRVALARAVGGAFLWLFGSRKMARKIRRFKPDLVVSTHPAVTNVLGMLRRGRRVEGPAVATITDLADHTFWAHPGIDLHLVMYDQAVERIEPVAGPGSVRMVRPLVSPVFLDPCDRREARARLGLSPDERIVLVSGGGWGVGDLDGAVERALRVPGARVMVLVGRNEVAQRRLAREYASQRRVEVLGFTDRMSDLLGAADAIIHSTGGVTALEALLRGCPVIAYGAPWGHARVNARLAESLGLGQRADTLDELSAALERIFDSPGFEAPALPPAPPAAELVLGARPRVIPRAAWAVHATRAATTGVAALLAVGWSLNSDDAYSLVSKPFHVKPLTHVSTSRPEVGLVVRAPHGTLPLVTSELARRRARASFALAGRMDSDQLRLLRAAGDDAVPELTRGKTMHWVKTRKILRHEARGLDLPHRFYFLTPDKGFNLGEYVVGRLSGARPVAGAVRMNLRSPDRTARVQRGQVVVVTLDPRSPDSMAAFDELLAALAARGLTTVPVADLAAPASPKALTSRELASRPEAAATTSSETARTAPPSGVAPQGSSTSTGASRAGTIS